MKTTALALLLALTLLAAGGCKSGGDTDTGTTGDETTSGDGYTTGIRGLVTAVSDGSITLGVMPQRTGTGQTRPDGGQGSGDRGNRSGGQQRDANGQNGTPPDGASLPDGAKRPDDGSFTPPSGAPEGDGGGQRQFAMPDADSLPQSTYKITADTALLKSERDGDEGKTSTATLADITVDSFVTVVLKAGTRDEAASITIGQPMMTRPSGAQPSAQPSPTTEG